jgi:hypothetical protein
MTSLTSCSSHRDVSGKLRWLSDFVKTGGRIQSARLFSSTLGHLCVHPNGRKRAQILALLMSKPSADIEEVEGLLSRLLLVLQRDGYLLESAGRYTFRSFLLREYWHRRYVT